MSILKKNIAPDAKEVRPKNIAEARALIERTFAEMDWDAVNRKFYTDSIHVSDANSPDGVRRIIESFERDKLVLFED